MTYPGHPVGPPVAPAVSQNLSLFSIIIGISQQFTSPYFILNKGGSSDSPNKVVGLEENY